jgi:hypothetical protein
MLALVDAIPYIYLTVKQFKRDEYAGFCTTATGLSTGMEDKIQRFNHSKIQGFRRE